MAEALPCPNPWCRSDLIVRQTKMLPNNELGITRRMCGSCGLIGPAAKNDAEATARWNDRGEAA